MCRKETSPQRPRQAQTDKKPQWLRDKKKSQAGIDLTEERDAPPQENSHPHVTPTAPRRQPYGNDGKSRKR